MSDYDKARELLLEIANRLEMQACAISDLRGRTVDEPEGAYRQAMVDVGVIIREVLAKEELS